MIGYTATAAVERLAKEHIGSQKRIIALAAMAKLKGCSNRQIRDQLKDDAPSWLSKALTIADKFMAAGLSYSTSHEVLSLSLEEALDRTVKALEAHMTALEVTSLNAYTKVCHFPIACEASRLVLNASKEPEVEVVKALEPIALAPVPMLDLVAEAGALAVKMTAEQLARHVAECFALMSDGTFNDVLCTITAERAATYARAA